MMTAAPSASNVKKNGVEYRQAPVRTIWVEWKNFVIQTEFVEKLGIDAAGLTNFSENVQQDQFQLLNAAIYVSMASSVNNL